MFFDDFLEQQRTGRHHRNDRQNQGDYRTLWGKQNQFLSQKQTFKKSAKFVSMTKTNIKKKEKISFNHKKQTSK